MRAARDSAPQVENSARTPSTAAGSSSITAMHAPSSDAAARARDAARSGAASRGARRDDGEARSVAGLAREREPVVEQRGEAPDDREAEPHAGGARLVGAPRHLEELVEDALAVLGRDADAGVDDLDRDVASPRRRAPTTTPPRRV